VPLIIEIIKQLLSFLGWDKEKMVEYETQASAVMTICRVLLSTLFNDDNQKETGSGVTLDSVREKHVVLNGIT